MIGIIGYGRFGKLAARYLAQDFEVTVCGRKPVPVPEIGHNIRSASLDEVCRQRFLILAVPISAMRDTLATVAPKLGPDTVVIDVCSVKVYPVQWMLERLPAHVPILATHPMFGPDSAADSLQGMKIALCPVRIEPSLLRKIRDYLEEKQLTVIETTAEDHDRQIAVSLSLTHFIGRSLADFGAAPMPIDTEGYKRLLHILGVVEHDTWQLFVDMNRYNPYAAGTREAFLAAADRINRELEK
jgi:prephenate dehydrogenase